MTVVLLAVGSRGDVQPLAVLAGALCRQGADVAVVALEEYADLVIEFGQGARVVPVAGRLEDAVRRGGLRDALGSTSVGQLVLLKRWVAGFADSVLHAVLAETRPGDTVVSGVLSRGVAAALATARGCRAATIVYTGQPPTLRHESYLFPHYLTGWRPYDTWGTRFSWEVSTSIGSVLTREARRRLALPPLGWRDVSRDADRHPTIVAASPILVPPAPDWAAEVHQSGYLAPPSRPAAPGSEAADFLSGPPPVYVGFGSLTRFTSADDLEVLASAARRARHPVITLAQAGMEEGLIAPGLFATRAVPFDWLFTQVAATIHHGGAGTTHEALRSGVPSAVIPIGVDQPYHAGRLHALGVGPASLPHRRLCADRLAALIEEVLDSPRAERYRRRALEVGASARAEDGVAGTVELMRRLELLA